MDRNDYELQVHQSDDCDMNPYVHILLRHIPTDLHIDVTSAVAKVFIDLVVKNGSLVMRQKDGKSYKISADEVQDAVSFDAH